METSETIRRRKLDIEAELWEAEIQVERLLDIALTIEDDSVERDLENIAARVRSNLGAVRSRLNCTFAA